MHAVASRLYDGSPFPISPINEPSVKGHIELKPHSLHDSWRQVAPLAESYGSMPFPEASG